MTSTERQRRFVARLRERAATSFVAADGVTIRVTHLAMDPDRAGRWLCEALKRLGKAQAFADAYNQALVSGGTGKPMS